ncbi:MAG TPA: hypothetical protein DCZ03_10455, partial [Gammaproteobacteria bacterium]|nr:hypothetical protein [Gammaproteobacteria bacterium]
MLKISRVQAAIALALEQLVSVRRGGISYILIGFLSLTWSALSFAAASLTAVEAESLGKGIAQVRLILSEPVEAPLSFTVDNPARVALDLLDVSNEINRNQKPQGAGIARQIRVVEGQGKTRVVVSLDSLVPYETKVMGNEVIVLFGEQEKILLAKKEETAKPSPKKQTVTESISNQQKADTKQSKAANTKQKSGQIAPIVSPVRSPLAAVVTTNTIDNIDFRRGQSGQGQIIVELSNPGVPVDVRERGGKIVMEFASTALPSHLYQRVDVLDFGTPIMEFETAVAEDKAQIVVSPKGEYDYLSFQLNDVFTLEVKEIPPEEIITLKQQEFTGQKLSLNFQS